MRERLRRVRNISLKRLFLAAAVLGLLIAVSVGGYLASESRSTSQETRFGDFGNPNRVNVVAWITRVDPAAQVFWMTVIDVNPAGTLADQEGNFTGDATLITNGIGNWRHTIEGGTSSPDIEQHLTLAGTFTDYPFDDYKSSIELRVLDQNGRELPTAVTLYNVDAFFQMSATQGRSPSGGTVINLDLQRSTPTMVFAAFIMVLMLGLAAAAAVAAYYVLNWKRGLVFGACSMMAAILFALIPLRNAVPGSPPIGSIIDFGSFFIAEAVISISLISSIVFGFRHQMALERAEGQAVNDLGGAPSGQAVSADQPSYRGTGDPSDGPEVHASHEADPPEGSDSSD